VIAQHSWTNSTIFIGFLTALAVLALTIGCGTEKNVVELQQARKRQTDRQEELLALMDENQLDAIVLGSTWGKRMPIRYIWEDFPAAGENASQLENEGNPLTAVSSASGFPVLTIPVGITRDGHPVSIPVIGRPFSEPYLISLAPSFADAYRQHTRTLHPIMMKSSVKTMGWEVARLARDPQVGNPV
jgi:Asp-tRNA(Asn)/Glu-tRNA(Gln) amidotransferase A subunit family amidase